MTAAPPDTTRELRDLQTKLHDISQDLSRPATFFRPSARARAHALQAAVYDRRRELIARVPHFWLRALIHHPAFALLVTHADSRALRALRDVRVLAAPAKGATPAVGPGPGPGPGPRRVPDFTVEFEFAQNDCFDDRVLVKTVRYDDRRGRLVGTQPIRWKSGVRNRVAEGKAGFFDWVQADDRDVNGLGEIVRDEVFPHAIDLYFATYSTLPHDSSYLDPRQR